MSSYVVRRLARAAVTLFVVTVGVFLLLHSIPGNIGWILLGKHATAAKAARLDRQLGLDLPLPLQYIRWLSLFLQQGLMQNLSLVAPVTLEYLAVAGGVSLVVSVVLAALQARYAGSVFDRVSSAVVYFASTVPSFWIGLLLIYVFALTLVWLPGSGPYPGPGSEGFGNWLVYMILPTAALVVPAVAAWSGLFRAEIEESLRSDYVRTARAQGSPEARVLFRHSLRNALLPIITVAGMSLPMLLNNIIVLEFVFRVQGIGSLLVVSLFSFNFSEALDLVLIVSIITVCGNFLADLLYAVADPRMRFD